MRMETHSDPRLNKHFTLTDNYYLLIIIIFCLHDNYKMNMLNKTITYNQKLEE